MKYNPKKLIIVICITIVAIIVMSIFIYLKLFNKRGKDAVSSNPKEVTKSEQPLDNQEKTKEPELLTNTSGFDNPNCEVKKNIVDGTDNLYEFEIAELSNTDIIFLNSFCDKVIIVYRSSDNYASNSICILNPISMKIEKNISIGNKYFLNSIRIMDDKVGITNIVNHSIDLYDINLNLVNSITCNKISDNSSPFFSVDLKNVFYVDKTKGEVNNYNLDTKTEKKVLLDIKIDEYSSLCIDNVSEDGKVIVYSYFDKEKGDRCTYIKDIESQGKYIYTYGSVLKYDYDENQIVYTCNGSGEIDVNYVTNNFNNRQILNRTFAEKGNNTDISLKNEVVTTNASITMKDKIRCTIRLYNIKTGIIERELNINKLQYNNAVVDGENRSYAFFDNKNYVVFRVSWKKGEEEDNKFYLWDLSKESSMLSDADNEYNINHYTKWVSYDEKKQEDIKELEDKAKHLETDYGIKVSINEAEKRGYKLDNLCGVENAINIIENELKKYPKELFLEINNYYGNPLVLSFSSGLEGATEADDITGAFVKDVDDSGTVKRSIFIKINGDMQLEIIFHHEIFHVIENYMYDNNCYFANWNSWNPKGFNYSDNYASEWVEKNTLEDKENITYFVRPYSTTFEKEDRADIMSYIMQDKNSIYTSIVDYSEVKWKANYLSDMLRKSFYSKNWPSVTYWEDIIAGAAEDERFK